MTMMRVASGALAVTLASLLICCYADPIQKQDVSAADRFDSGLKGSEGSLVRQVREAHHPDLLPHDIIPPPNVEMDELLDHCYPGSLCDNTEHRRRSMGSPSSLPPHPALN
ncbi:orcokinin peptides-like [Leguminivora glycinivorella]|uniref:orcokinin peptides-like n=1 Tax=Leguminivora glycinivorella TaxID=1035111 RepID=UPI00200C654A|nr:orcokinin peptides-like [Leguminivora glycinivorella]